METSRTLKGGKLFFKNSPPLNLLLLGLVKPGRAIDHEVA